MGEFKKQGGFGGGRRQDFNRGGSDRPRFGGGSSFNRRDGERGQMFAATCDNCHKQCEVPFRPTGSKPVYCKDCFALMRDGEDRGSERREHRDGGYPKKDFGGHRPAESQGNDKRIEELQRQLGSANAKLDRIVSLLEKSSAPKPFPILAEETVEKTITAPVKAAAKPKKEVKKSAAKPAKKPAKKK